MSQRPQYSQQSVQQILAKLHTLALPEAIEQVESLLEMLPTCGQPALLEAIAHNLPKELAPLAPEVQSALQRLAYALKDYRPRFPNDLHNLEPGLTIRWLRAKWASGLFDDLHDCPEQQLLHLMNRWTFQEQLAPQPLFERLLKAKDVRLRKHALDWISPAVKQLAITAEEAFSYLILLAEDPHLSLRLNAIQGLSAQWLRGLPFQARHQREKSLQKAIQEKNALLSKAAIETIASLGERSLLLSVLADEQQDDAVCALALEKLGPLCQDEDLPIALGLGLEEPLCFGPSARSFLLEAHRRGIFIREEHLSDLLALYDKHQQWTGEELVRVTYIVRHELIEELAKLPAKDLRWKRRAEILAASTRTKAHELLGTLLDEVQDPDIAKALIEAASHSPDYTGEERLLKWFSRLPETTLYALQVKGEAKALKHLQRVALAPETSKRFRADVMEVVWAQSRQRDALLKDWCQRLGPHESKLLRNKLYVSPRDPSIARILQNPPWDAEVHEAIEAVDAFKIYCESGDIEYMPKVIEGFRQIFRNYVRKALEGDFTIKRLKMPELEQMLFRYGRHLLAAGRHIRRWREASPETGRDLVLLVACDWLQESPSDAITVALLELIGRHAPSGGILRTIEPYWRHRHKGVQRAAIEAILEAGEEARGLELSLCKLVKSKDPRIVVQALATVATLKAKWAESIVIEALQRPEMGIKKEAASALIEIGTAQAIPALVEWLSYHDNSSFRGLLHSALCKSSGENLIAILLHALRQTQEPRRKELLWDALSRHISLAMVLRLARSEETTAKELVKACLDGRIRLKDANHYALARACLATPSLPPV